MDINFKHQYRIELAETLSGHWYSVWELNKTKKEKFLGHFASVTTYLNAYPTSEQLMQWMSSNGFHESRAIRDAAGKAGTRIHLAAEELIGKNTIYKSNYSTEEWVKLESFVKWYHEYQPEILATELPIFSKKYGYAGRIDCIAKTGNAINVLDWKSSRSIHSSMALQFSAYAVALEEMTDLKIDNTAAVQLGAQNNNGYRYILYPDWRNHFKIFLNVKKTWEYDTGYIDKDKKPPVLNLPTELKL